MASDLDRSRCATYRDEMKKSLKVCEDIHLVGLRRDEEPAEPVVDSEHSLPKEPSIVEPPPAISRDVFLRYGPYESCGIVEHRLHRLRGMEERLRKKGYEVHMEPINDWNVVELWLHGELVFNCDIRDLDFGGDGLLDGLCLEAADRVENAF